MKRLYGLFVLLCLMLTACNDDFLDVDPVDRYSDAVVWTDESLITSFVNNIYEGQKWGFHTVMLSSLCDESMEVWAWESQPVVMSELSPSYQGILAPNFWIITFHNITWTNLYKNIRACNIFFEKVLRNKWTPLQIVITNGYTCSIFQVAKITKRECSYAPFLV